MRKQASFEPRKILSEFVPNGRLRRRSPGESLCAKAGVSMGRPLARVGVDS
jgi:hypothetical protein